MNRPHAFAGLIAALLAFHAGGAAAQVYKWVDERGRVNYSSQLPADPKTADKVAVVEDRVSVYTPDPALLREVAAERQRASQPAPERRDNTPPAVAMIGGTTPAPSATAEPLVYDYPYIVGGGFRPHRPLPLHKVPQVRLPAGATAGNTVGLYSIIPGSSSPVPGTWSPVAPQPAPRPRWEEPRPMPHGGQGWRR